MSSTGKYEEGRLQGLPCAGSFVQAGAAQVLIHHDHTSADLEMIVEGIATVGTELML